MVEILVGPSEHPFRVHKGLLFANVPYFDKMFNGGFKETEDQAAKLPEDDPVAFDLFLEWIYRGFFQEFGFDKSDMTTTRGHWIDRIKLYSFAQKISLSDLTDYSITTILSNYKKHARLPLPKEMELTY
jgi:hypothetical protein